MHNDCVKPVVVFSWLFSADGGETFGAEAVHVQRRRDVVIDLGHVVLVPVRRKAFQLENHDTREHLVLYRPLGLVQPRALGAPIFVVLPEGLLGENLPQEQGHDGGGFLFLVKRQRNVDVRECL